MPDPHGKAFELLQSTMFGPGVTSRVWTGPNTFELQKFNRKDRHFLKEGIMRKIIQVVSTVCPNHTENYFQRVTALCDDGSLWELSRGGKDDKEWSKLPTIPQDIQDTEASDTGF